MQLNLKRGLIIVVIVALIPAGWLAWWLASPLFIDKTVEEEFPMASSAVVPEGMTRAEAEKVMETMAKIDSPMEEPMEEEMAEAASLKSGAFRDGDSFHRGGGAATIYRLGDSAHVLRLESFKVTNGPDLRVILTPHPDPSNSGQVKQQGYIEIGKLKGNIGNQNYPLPDDADPAAFNAVVIYCKPFNVVFSVAPLEADEGG